MASHKPHVGLDLPESVQDLVLVTPTWTTQSWWAELSQFTTTTWPIPSSQKLTGEAHLSTNDLNSSVTDVMRLPKKPRTLQVYASVLKHYYSWCHNQDILSRQATWQQRLSCLAQIADTSQLATGTIKNLRTGMSEYTPLVERKPFSQLPERAFMKGLERKKPVPRKDLRAKWEIADLVRYLQAMPPWEELSLMQKGQKTQALLCIATDWRPAADFARTLASVDFEFAAGPEWPTSLVLTAIDVKEGGDKQSKVIPRLLEYQYLCPALATFRYLQDSKQIRPANAIFLFAAANPPHANLTADRLRNWLKATMLAAGIAVHFTPHFIRAVTTSAAFEAGTPLEDILTCAHWSNSTTFDRFYPLRSSRAWLHNLLASCATARKLYERTSSNEVILKDSRGSTSAAKLSCVYRKENIGRRCFQATFPKQKNKNNKVSD